MNYRLIGFVGVICFFVAGCGVKLGKVSGKVTYKGAVVPGGTVQFWPQESKGNPAGALIKEDGSYTAMVPVGDAAVTVETESVSGKAKSWLENASKTKGSKSGGHGMSREMLEEIKGRMKESGKEVAGPQKGNYVRINETYSKPGVSGLKTTVQAGEQQFNIDLK